MITAAVLTALAAGGCATQSAGPAALTPESSLTRLEARSLENPDLLTFIAERSGRPPGSWNFETLAWAGLFYSDALDAARARVSAAEAAAQAAAELPNPALGLTLGRNGSSGIPSPWINSLRLDLPIETAGRRQPRAARAEQLALAARLDLASVAWRVRGRIRRAWVDFLAARGTAALLREQAGLREESLRLQEVRLTAGDASGGEVTAARLDLGASRLASADAARAEREARIRLAEAVGVPDAALENARLSTEGFGILPEISASPEVRRRALLNRADLLAALADYSAAHAALELEVAKQFPELRLGPGYTYDQGENKWSLGFTLTMPVFGRNRGAIAEARARREEAAAAFQVRQASVLAEIDRALVGWSLATQRGAELSAMATDLDRSEAIARARHAAGQTPKTELIAVLLQANASSVSRHEALVRSQRALCDLEEAVQVPSTLPVEAWRTAPVR